MMGRPQVIYHADWKGHRAQILEGNSPERTQLTVHGGDEPKNFWIRVRDREETENFYARP